MAEIDGVYEGPSIGRAVARHKYKKAMAEHESGGGMEGEEGGHEKLAAVHGEHAKNAKKSFHIYQHEDESGIHHTHAHDHVSGKHEHREHPDMEGAMEHLHEHLGGEPAPGPDVEAPEPTEGAGEGMGALGLGGGPPEA